VRRARRVADLSQRDLAAIIGLAQSRVSRIESGHDVGVETFARILGVAGLRIAIVDDTGAEVSPMPPDVLRDGAGRRQPSHLDVHAAPELPIPRLLLRRADPRPRESWHHRRPERDRMRSSSPAEGIPEQPTAGAVAPRRSRA
jgi:HTH-type transcriptional regulator/antitoxin HipB